MDRFHKRVGQHANTAAFNFLTWRDIEVHVIGFAWVKFAVDAIHTGGRCCSKAWVWAAGKVWRAVLDGPRAGYTQHLGSVIAAIRDSHRNPCTDEFGSCFEAFIGVNRWGNHGHVTASVIQDTG